MSDRDDEEFEVANVPEPLINLLDRVNILILVTTVFRGWSTEVAASKKDTVSSLAKVKRNLLDINRLIQLLQNECISIKEEEHQAQYLVLKTEYIENNIPDKFNCPPNIVQASQNAKSGSDLAIKEKEPVRKELLDIPKIPYLTQDEFNKVPKYLKGRIAYDKVNEFVDVLNKVIYSKYSVFKKKKSTLKKKDADLWNEYNKQELKETKGMYFCVADDFKRLSRNPLDKMSLTLLSILRHCGKIREVRGGGILRYMAVY